MHAGDCWMNAGYDKSAADFSALRERVEAVGVSALAEKLGVGEPTLNDIINELVKPGRDPRDELPKPAAAQ